MCMPCVIVKIALATYVHKSLNFRSTYYEFQLTAPSQERHSFLSKKMDEWETPRLAVLSPQPDEIQTIS
jgi:hypothetical protein